MLKHLVGNKLLWPFCGDAGVQLKHIMAAISEHTRTETTQLETKTGLGFGFPLSSADDFQA